MKNINVPVGISNFEKIRQDGYYYVDKTGLIKDMLKNKIPEVTLITRPRRFGKTLAMSMLASFFDIRRDSKKLFQGLNISKEQQLCNDWMNQYPTLFLSFKDVDGTIFENALGLLQFTIAELCKKHTYLIESDVVDQDDKETFRKLKSMGSNLPELQGSIIMLMNMMKAYYNKQVILLIDEYDVPIAKASSNGYYKEMLEVMKAMLSTALKDNEALKFAVVTGCLKIAKESVFTGTNNFVSDTISSERYNEYYGFTQKDVDQILQDAQIEEKASDIKEWYDGYRFEKASSIYSPRSVVAAMTSGICDSYWNQTETFEALRGYIDMNFDGLKDDVLSMMAGEMVPVNTGSFSNDMTTFHGEDDVLTLLIHLGYLGYDFSHKSVFIPNNEIRGEFVNAVSVSHWGEVSKALKNSADLLNAIWKKDEEKVAAYMEQAHFETSHLQYNDENALSYTVSLALYAARNFYQVYREFPSGSGFADIVYLPRKGFLDKPALIVELKWNKSAEGAIQQILKKQYFQNLEDYSGNMLLVGINYDLKTRKHECKILEFKK